VMDPSQRIQGGSDLLTRLAQTEVVTPRETIEPIRAKRF
jgi:hypothetical protein